MNKADKYIYVLKRLRITVFSLVVLGGFFFLLSFNSRHHITYRCGIRTKIIEVASKQ